MQPYRNHSLRIILFLTVLLLLLSAVAMVSATGHIITTNIIGSGQINIMPDQTEYESGDVITMTATADPGWQFSEWHIEYSDWWDTAWHYRLPLAIMANGYDRFDGIAEVDINFSSALWELGQYGYLSLDSLRVIEVDADGTILDTAVPFQFDQAGDFDAANNAWGTLIIQLTNITSADAIRHYNVYFDINSNAFTPATFASQVTVTNTIDEGQDSFQVNSAVATYFFQKQAGGFSSLLDSAGNDWIGFNPTLSSGGAGEFRGIPNLLPPESGGYFHPGTTTATSYLARQGSLKATINSYIPETNWATRWEFYPRYAKMTVTGVGAEPYWFLYEGTPGGTFDVENDFIVRSDGVQTPTNIPWSGDLTSDEWVYFGAPAVDHSLFLANTPDDEHIDSYFPLESLMTVFGFGRADLNAYMQNSGQQFTIGLVEGTNLALVTTAIDTAVQPLGIERGSLQYQTTAVSSNNPFTHAINGHTTITAVFEAELYNVETSVSGQGSLTVTPTQDSYLYGDAVTFTATADPGWIFSGWQGDLIGSENPATLIVSTNQAVQALFERNQPPVLETIPDQTAKPGQNITFTVTAISPDGIIPTLTAIDLSAGMSFEDNGDGTAVFDWIPTSNAIGQHQIILSANDAELSTEQVVTFNIIPYQNWLPLLFSH
ncbi:MAG: hypothetical protein KDE48_13445 [Anaerolineales bacterium]|nr:hypothetical protein [Anaerolineales bacterium]